MADDSQPKPTVAQRGPKHERKPTPVKTIPRSAEEEASLRVEVIAPDAAPDAGGAVVVTELAAARYYTGAEIARGGMGRVVEASDSLLGRVVAVKEALSTDDEALRRFARETQITARLEHPSIVPVYDAGTGPDGMPFYVMRKVSGRPLAELIDGAKTLADRLALLPHLLATAQAVAHAHGHNIIHRDLKPGNILVGDLGETVVIDWGLAKELGELDDPYDDHVFDAGTSLHTRMGVVFGTPGFMSPEQLNADPVDARADVYALGACLYQLLSQQPPHTHPSSDVMMDSARNGPPTPLTVLEPGVPAELTTIVDKALAYSLDVRYRDAAALAEDLKRFLTGQLVAAHRYSPRERIVRFVRQHRVPVIAVTAATIAAIAIGVLAINRVVVARDRADDALEVALVEKHAAETATAAANDRADQLTLVQARALIETNPTAAIALVKTLAGNAARWREVRAIAAGAQAAGAAWGLPGPDTITSLAIAPSGQRALAVGDGGDIYLYDLAARTTRTLAGGAPLGAAFLDDDHLALYASAQTAILDLPTGGRHVAPAANVVATSARALYGLDPAGVLSETTTAGATTQLATLAPGERAAHAMWTSPDGNWLIVGGAAHALLADLRVRPLAFVPIGDAVPRTIAWDAASTTVAISTATKIFDVALGSPPTVRAPFAQPDAVVFASVRDGDELYEIGGGGVHRVSASAPDAVIAPPSSTTDLGLALAADGTLVVGGAPGTLLAIRGSEARVMTIPGDAVARFAARPASRFVIAAMRGRVLLWDVATLFPRRLAIGDAMAMRIADNAHAILLSPPAPTRWIDLATGVAQTGPAANPFAPVVVAPDGARFLEFDAASKQLALIARGAAAPTPIAGDVAFAMFERDDILVGTHAGDLARDDATTHARTPMFSHAASLDALAQRGGWLAAQFGDGLLWRRAPDGRVESRTIADYDGSDGAHVQLLSDGAVVSALDRNVSCWFADGRVVKLATLPAAIDDLVALDGDALLVTTADHALYRLDRPAPPVGDAAAQPTLAISVLPAGGGAELATAPGADPLVVATDGGRIDVVDPLTASRWTLRPPGPALAPAEISRDGKTVIVRATTGELLVWRLELPTSAAELPAWLETLTNATAEHGPATVSWR